ncbi:MAG: hypothetical protein IKP40_09025 [Clostridia bacterium]|nr:hypothetical protein [Clostridia bacterium]
MANRRTLNFDNFIMEKDREPVYVTVFGKEYPVRPEIPAIVPVQLARAGLKASDDVSEGDSAMNLIRAGDIMLGREAMDEICAKGLSTADLGALIMKLFELVNGTSVDGDESEELDDESGLEAAGGKAKK